VDKIRGGGTGDDDASLLELFRAIASRDNLEISQLLSSAPDLANRSICTGASRQDAETYFLTPIHHYAYEGDTPLHIAAAAYYRDFTESLIADGADVCARNRRGAEPLHYAADGSPGSEYWDPVAQSEVIAILISAGANPDALDKSGVAPLHRAVRTRSSAAVSVLIENGADCRLMNGSGSTPLHLAVQNTGRSDSGSEAAKDQQRRIIDALLQNGASPTDVDTKGKTVAAMASSDWIRHLLDAT
jgi:ankyrin repeat protein